MYSGRGGTDCDERGRTLSLGRSVLLDLSAAALSDGLVERRRPDRDDLDGLLRTDAGDDVAGVWRDVSKGSVAISVIVSSLQGGASARGPVDAQTGRVNSSPLASILTTSLIMVASSLPKRMCQQLGRPVDT